MSAFKIGGEIIRRSEYAYVLPELVLTIPTPRVQSPQNSCLIVEPFDGESFQISYGSVDDCVCSIATPNPNLVCLYRLDGDYMFEPVLVDISTRTFKQIGYFFVTAVEIPEISTLLLLDFNSFVSIDHAGKITVYDRLVDDNLEFLGLEPNGFRMRGSIDGKCDVEFIVATKAEGML